MRLLILMVVSIATAGCSDGAAAPDAETCSGDAALPPPGTIEAPTLSEWRAVVDGLPAVTADSSTGDDLFPLSIDRAVCADGAYFVWLGLGSAWAHVHRRDDGACEVWVGGETENPLYDGWPTQYCRFPPSCGVIVAAHWGDGGPASVESPHCVAPGHAP